MANTPSASNLLTQVAQPGYWQRQLDLMLPDNPGDTGDVGGALHHPPSVGGPGPVRGESGGSGGGGTGGGGGDGGEGDVTPLDDWDNALIAMGMPPELVNAIKQYWIAHKDDPNVQTSIKQIVRGSDWWKQTFPGFWAGYSSGLFGDETGYRAWYKASNDSFKRYFGRDMTAGETVGYLTNGFSPTTIEQIGAGHAYVEANRPDIQYTEGAFDTAQLTEEELTALGQQQAGRQTDLGTRVQARVDAAMKRMQGVFRGQLASPNFQVGGAGLSAPSLNPKQKPDISA